MATSSKANSDKYVNEAIERLAKLEPDNHAKVKSDPAKLATLRTEMKKSADELLETIHNVKQIKGKQITIAEAFKHLPKERIDKITSSFRNQTFTMKVQEKRGVRQATTMHGGNEFISAISLPSNDASNLQIASIIVESAIFILDIIGIHVPQNREALKEAIDIVKEALGKSNAFNGDVDELQKAYQNGDTLGMAKAILKIAIDLFGEGLFIPIAKALLSNMGWFDWIITAGRITVFLVALVATAGAAEIAEIVSLLLDAADFLNKLANLPHLA